MTPWRVAGVALAVTAALAVATLAAAVLEGDPLRVLDASPIYLVVVAFAAVRYGTLVAAVAGLAAFLLYNYLFTEPRFTLLVSDSREWLNLLLFLFAAMVIGRLAAAAGQRAAEAERRAIESQALFRVSRTLALADATRSAATRVLDGLVLDTAMDRLWFSRLVGAREVTIADTAAGEPRPAGPLQSTLSRTAGDAPARWVLAHRAAEPPRSAERRYEEAGPAPSQAAVFRVRVEAEGQHLGWLVGVRPRRHGAPNREETRLLALAADQLGLALRRDTLAAVATDAEVARRSEALKTALLDTVSHDLRTPLAGIRAAAGALMDPAVEWTKEERRAAAATIDQEAERLDRLVRNVLELSRIQAGALTPQVEVYDVEDLVRSTVTRLRPLLGGALVEETVEPDLPFVSADAVFLDTVIGNLLENAARHAPGAAIRISIERAGSDVAIVVEDAGPGVPEEALPNLFDKFFRVRRRGEGPHRGMGLGLSVVRGLVEAMGGTVAAYRAGQGGLAIRVELPGAAPLGEGSG